MYQAESSTVIDLFQEIKKIPVVVMGYADEAQFLQSALNAGAIDYVLKDNKFYYIEYLLYTISNSLLIHKLTISKESVPMNKREYADIIQAVPDIIYKIDQEGFFTFINNAILMLDYTPDELIGKHFKTIIHPGDYENISRKEIMKKYSNKKLKDSDKMKCFDERRRGKRKTEGLEIRLIPKTWNDKSDDSSIIFGSVIAFGELSAQGYYMQVDDQQVFLGTIGIIHNITERKNAEVLIRKLYEAVNQSPISILIADAEGTIEYANPHFFKQSGFTKKDIISQNIIILVNDRIKIENKRLKDRQREFADAMEKKIEWQGELISAAKDGKQFWEAVHIKPIVNQDNEISHLLVLKSDISELKEMEKILKQINDELDKRVKHRTIELEKTNENLQAVIKERVRVEEKLRQSEEKFRTFLETASDFMHMTDKDGYFIYANESMVKALGYVQSIQ